MIKIKSAEFKAKLSKLKQAIEPIAPKLPYHNLAHLIGVADASERIGLEEGLSDEDLFILQSASLLHDIVYEPSGSNNEEQSASLAGSILAKLGYSQDAINKVARLIMATKPKAIPADLPEMVICDADIDYLGREDFFELCEKLRQEYGAGKKGWYARIEREFLSKAKYYTKTARKLRAAYVKENLKKLQQIKSA